MPFTKTEVDIHDDYTVEAVDAAWLAQGVKSPKHLMLDPDNCILCRACEDVCPWNCIWMMSNEIVEDSDEESVAAEVHGRTRCSSSTTPPVRAAPCAWTGAHRHPVLCATARGLRRPARARRRSAGTG